MINEQKSNMKTQPMSAEEWFKSDKQNSHYWATDEDLQFAQDYSTYLLKHHLEQFVEEINNEFHKSGTISSILNDYLTKNNI